jgi:hypothetical protein
MCWGCGKDITKESYRHFSSHPACANIIANEEVLQRHRNPTPVVGSLKIILAHLIQRIM